MYGEGQQPNSLLAQLDQAINNGEASFNMSGGEQLRDYLPIEQVASLLVGLVEHSDANGVFNVCSGRPISVRRLVEEHLVKRQSDIRLNLGYYEYPKHEPMAFWGDRRKLNRLLKLIE